MIANIPSHIFINETLIQIGKNSKKISCEILNEGNSFTVELLFIENCEVNNVGIVFNVENAEIIFMPRLQKGNRGLVCNDSNTQIILLKSKDSFVLFEVCGILKCEEKYLRFATKVKENLLYVGFFHSFWIDEVQSSFCYQNLLLSSEIKKGTTVEIKVKLQKGSSIYDCVENFNPVVRTFELGLNVETFYIPKYIGIVDITKYSKSDIAKRYQLSISIPSKILKLCFLYFPKKLMNFEFLYTASLQTSCFYYMRILNEFDKNEILRLKERIELLTMEGKIYFNFYNNNLMLTTIKTHYHLPYVLLLYNKLCSLTGTEIEASIAKLIDEIEWHVIKNNKFYTDETLMNIKDFNSKFENKIYPSETLTIYICYELYRFLFKYYEKLDYYKINNDLKALLFLNCNFNDKSFYKNNYSFRNEKFLKINEREDKR